MYYEIKGFSKNNLSRSLVNFRVRVDDAMGDNMLLPPDHDSSDPYKINWVMPLLGFHEAIYVHILQVDDMRI